MGNIYKETGEWEKALEYYRKVRELKKSIGDVMGDSGLLNVISCTNFLFGNYHQAIKDYEESLKIAKITDDAILLSCILSTGGKCYLDICDFKKALQCEQKRLHLTQNMMDLKTKGSILAHISNIDLAQGNLSEAEAYLEESLKFRDGLKDKGGIGECFFIFGKLFLEKGKKIKSRVELEKALKYTKDAIQFFEKAYNVFELPQAKLLLARIYLYLGEYEEAKEWMLKSRQRFTELTLFFRIKETEMIEGQIIFAESQNKCDIRERSLELVNSAKQLFNEIGASLLEREAEEIINSMICT